MAHRRTKMIKEDFGNCIRLLHTIEKQVFDAEMYREVKKAANSSKNRNFVQDKVELNIFEVVDLFIRDSSLGLYESRLKVVELMYKSFVLKQELLHSKGKS